MPTVSDDFNRANANNLGANWTRIAAGMGIASNQADPINFGGDQWEHWAVAVDDFGDDHYTKVIVGTGLSSGGYESFVMVRFSGTSPTQNFYFVQYGDGTGNAKLSSCVNGGTNQLQDLGTTVAAGDEIKLDVTGTDLKVYKNGSQIGTTQTDSALSSGQPGLGGHFTGHDVFNSFEASDGAGGGPVVRRFLLVR